MPIRIQPLDRRTRLEADPLADDIRALLEKAGLAGDENADLMAEAIGAVLKTSKDKTTRGEMKILSTAVKEMRYAFKVFAAYRDIPKVSVFGSARTPKDDPTYAAAVEFSKQITAAGWMVITGAGGGIMEAGQDGAGRERSFGVAIRLPFEQSTNMVIDRDHKLVNFKYFFTRKLSFVKEAKAVCVLPGGFGTLDEAFEVLTLVQTGKASPMPIVLLDAPGGKFWLGWRSFVREHLLARRLISAEDEHLLLITDSVEAAVADITGFYRRYHSSRYVNRDLIIRLSSPLPTGALDRLNAEFADLLAPESSGVGIRALSEPLPEEENESEQLRTLPRLQLHFNRRNLGRLRQLINAINSA